jgi:hypothetical protein
MDYVIFDMFGGEMKVQKEKESNLWEVMTNL